MYKRNPAILHYPLCSVRDLQQSVGVFCVLFLSEFLWKGDYRWWNYSYVLKRYQSTPYVAFTKAQSPPSHCLIDCRTKQKCFTSRNLVALLYIGLCCQLPLRYVADTALASFTLAVRKEASNSRSIFLDQTNFGLLYIMSMAELEFVSWTKKAAGPIYAG